MTKNEFDLLPVKERLEKIDYFLNILHQEKRNILQQHEGLHTTKSYFFTPKIHLPKTKPIFVKIISNIKKIISNII